MTDALQSTQMLHGARVGVVRAARHDGFGPGAAVVTSTVTVHNGTVGAIAVPSGGLDITGACPDGSDL